MTTWPEAVFLIGLGVVLRSVLRIVRVLFARREDYLKFSRERRQMFAKDWTL